jgi:hypothetical protein
MYERVDFSSYHTTTDSNHNPPFSAAGIWARNADAFLFPDIQELQQTMEQN